MKDIHPYGEKESPLVDAERKTSDEKLDASVVEVRAPDGSTPDHEALNSAAKHMHLEMTQDDIDIAEERLNGMTLERTRHIMQQFLDLHEHDQNISSDTIADIRTFLRDPDVMAHPEKHSELVNAMKMEALIATENSPYAEVRAVVDPVDNPNDPSLTIRVWVVGIIFSGAGAFVNELFSIRQPSVTITSNVAQLLAFPAMKFLERVLPDKGFTLFGTRHSLNPGPFSRKEHMLITIMANTAFATPYTAYVILTQALPIFFNQSYSRNYGYQLLNTLSTNFIGYGLAGLTRRFIVWPSYCVWPLSLSTMALNKAFHADTQSSVPGPFKKLYSISRLRFFMYTLIGVFVYFWFPNFIFQATSTFNWMSWIAPDNGPLNNIVGSVNGLGVNPWPTFDWNTATVAGQPWVTPLFTVVNLYIGAIMAMFMIIGFYWNNTFNTSYLPINSNRVFDRYGVRYNVSRILDDRGVFVEEAYQQYSEPYMAAGNITIYFWFFAAYSSTVCYVLLYHRREIAHGFRSLWRDIKKAFRSWRSKTSAEEAAEVEDADDLGADIHLRLMRRYKEVPEWWYLTCLVLSVAFGISGLAGFPTGVSPGIVFYGLLLAAIFLVPLGIIGAVTGNAITLNVLAQFIGGSIVEGNAISLNYFKTYGYITTAHALNFANDLKVGHYTKIPPRHTFAAQMVATLVSSVVCSALFNFQMDLKNVCTTEATFRMTCPGQNTFFTAAVFWGSIGPRKIFGAGGRYTLILLGFPVGVALVGICWALQKFFPRVKIFRYLHPALICTGGVTAWAPYNLSYMTPLLYLSLASWAWIKPRYLDWWSKYNYIANAAFSAGIAISAVIIFFTMNIPKLEIAWWGNEVMYNGCEGAACRRLPLPDSGFFGPELGQFN
ncbi:hypothetical protein Q8F55_002356 [Vanrija albida]|uniref:OPT family small oligopeptide transporter n=1 Tax=Vanrija albida TaxID=181172 RepID=A0ABR3Q9J4_9TREE